MRVYAVSLRYIAMMDEVTHVSLEDWDMLTWSFG